MMFKKRSLKSAMCLALACLMLAVVPLWEPQTADAYAEFSYYQYLDVDSNSD